MIEFVVTGVCRPGKTLNLELPKLLAQSGDVMLWIDFKEASDIAVAAHQVAHEAPELALTVASRAIWAGPSIVGSMLEAIAASLLRSDRWNQLVFCSQLDTALADAATIADYVSAECAYDYCGNRFNDDVWDLLPHFDRMPLTDATPATREWAIYPVRPEVTVRLETALSPIFTPTAMHALRFCNEMHERYGVGVWEDHILHTLNIHRLTKARADERMNFFASYGLYAGKQFCVLSRRFAELLISPAVIDLYHTWFSDILIPDECFFQTVAHHYEAQGTITAKWQNIFYANGYRVPFRESYRETREPHELLGRFSPQASRGVNSP